MNTEPSFARDCAVLLPSFLILFVSGIAIGLALGRRTERRKHTPRTFCDSIGREMRLRYMAGVSDGWSLAHRCRRDDVLLARTRN